MAAMVWREPVDRIGSPHTLQMASRQQLRPAGKESFFRSMTADGVNGERFLTRSD